MKQATILLYLVLSLDVNGGNCGKRMADPRLPDGGYNFCGWSLEEQVEFLQAESDASYAERDRAHVEALRVIEQFPELKPYYVKDKWQFIHFIKDLMREGKHIEEVFIIPPQGERQIKPEYKKPLGERV